MKIYLKEDDVEQLVTIPEVIQALDHAFRDQAAGRAWTNARNRLRLQGITLHMMAAAIPGARALEPGDLDADLILVAPAADEEQASLPVLELVGRLAAAGWSGELVTVGPGAPATALTAAIAATASVELSELRSWHLELPSTDPELIAQALRGTWQPEHLFALRQSLELYDYYHQQIRDWGFLPNPPKRYTSAIRARGPAGREPVPRPE